MQEDEQVSLCVGRKNLRNGNRIPFREHDRKGSGYGLELKKLNEAAVHFKTVAAKMEKAGTISSKVFRVDPNTTLYQVPGGMLTNLLSRLKQSHAVARMDEVRVVVLRVRVDFGYPLLVTPTSQIVGTQVVLNTLIGCYRSFTKKSKGLLRSEYGELPARSMKRFGRWRLVRIK